MTDAQAEYKFLPLEKVIYGVGTLARLADEADRLGCQRVFVLSGHTLATQTPIIKNVEAILGARHIGTYAGIQQHAPESCIKEATWLARECQTDLLVSVGGGSPIDAAKFVARALTGDDKNFLPHIAIPTTLSAAEFSHLAGYTDERSKAKTGIADPLVTPRVAILDPQLTLPTPMWLWLSTGIRALDHAVETLYSPGYHPINDLLALQAIRDLFAYLPRCKAEPENLDARLQCQLAAWLSFFGEASVQMGLSHNLGRRIGATYDVPHGVTSCILLAHVMRHKATSEASQLAPIAHVLNLANASTSDHDAALAAADGVSDLVKRLDLPYRLRDVNVPRAELDFIARVVVGAPQASQVVALLQQAW